MKRAPSATKLPFFPIFPNAAKYKLAKRHMRITKEDVVLKPLGVATPHGPIKSDLGP